MLAIIETCGKQYEVTEGRYVDFELLDAEEDQKFVFDKVLMLVDGENSKVGDPFIKGAVVEGKVMNHGKTKKVIVYKQRCKKGYRRKYGHRQGFTRVMIESISLAKKKAKKETTDESVEVKSED
jgi:large subunit ribosomal protein L21